MPFRIPVSMDMFAALHAPGLCDWCGSSGRTIIVAEFEDPLVHWKPPKISARSVVRKVKLCGSCLDRWNHP